MSSMLAVGSVAFDTLHMPHGRYVRVLGGAATYASIAASFFGPVQLVAVVGKDFPAEARELLRSRAVDLEGLEVADGLTFHWAGEYSADLNSRTTLQTDLNVFADFHPKIPEAWRSTRYVMLANIDPELQLEVLNQIKKPEFVIADTMNFWISSKLAELKKVLQRIDLLVINEEEARQLSGTYAMAKVARELLSMGPKSVVIKRGEYGALWFDHQDVFSAPAYPLEEVRDPTGAGDTFAGGLLGYVALKGNVENATLRRAIVYGSALASFCVEAVGLERLLTVNKGELLERFSRFHKLAHFASENEVR